MLQRQSQPRTLKDCELGSDASRLSKVVRAAVADVEACVGRGHKQLGPPAIPRKCQKAAERLDDCLVQRAAEVEGGVGDT